MKLILIMVALGFAGWQFFIKGHSGQYPDVYLPDGTPDVFLLTYEQCGAVCDKARLHLKSRGIYFNEVDAHKDEERWKELGGPRSFPFLLVGDQQAQGYNPGFFSSALGESLGTSGLSAQEQRIYAKHFDSAGEPKVVLYGTDWCGYCNRLRKRLEGDYIAYDYINMDKPDKKTWLMEAMGIYGYPVVYVGYERVQTPDFEHVVQALN